MRFRGQSLRHVPRLRHAEIERARRKPTDSIDAYVHFLRALALTNTLTCEDSREALRLLDRAIELDPNYAATYGLAAYCHMRQHIALRRGGRAKPSLKHRAIPSPQENLHCFELVAASTDRPTCAGAGAA